VPPPPFAFTFERLTTLERRDKSTHRKGATIESFREDWKFKEKQKNFYSVGLLIEEQRNE
jgi:hypothetical protein